MISLKLYGILLLILSIFEVESKIYKTTNNNTYYIEDKYVYTWFDAHLECSTRDMALLTIDSREKYDDIYELLISGKFTDKPPHLWVGAIGINRNFAWILTGAPIIPSFWCNVCPNNHGNNENCVEFWGNERGLNDLNCDNRIGFICEDRYDVCKRKQPNFILNIKQKC